MQTSHQTIFALASGRPPGALAIVRISGPRAGDALIALNGHLPTPRLATLATLRDIAGQPIDEAIVLWFRAPHSATGEDVAELHVHGGRAVLAAVIAALGAVKGLRAAEPGEFTRRAFENGKLDLTAAEGLDDLIHADTDKQRRLALRQLKGLLGDRAETWRRQIIDASALIEAGIDFSDEGDVPDDLTAPAFMRIAALKREIEETLAASAQSERLRDGLVVAIAGPPNAGKSTLLNRIARRDVAIVSPHAGTTRDVIEVHLDLDGYPVTLLDTAGIRETDDPVEQEGVRRARERAAAADLVLWLTDAADAGRPAPPKMPVPVWSIRNKADAATQEVREDIDPAEYFRLSALRGDGLADLMRALTGFVEDTFGSGENAVISRVRHRALLEESVNGLARALEAKLLGDELVAEELRRAIHALGRLTGRVGVENILDVIFRDFCIGK